MQTQKSLINYPKRGEIFVADLNPGFGRELHKKRPVLIISRNSTNRQLLHVVTVPISSQVPRLVGSDMILIGTSEGLTKKSVILPIYIRGIDKDRLIKKVGSLSKSKLQEVEDALKLILDIA
jgi:mRNA interferase MazF